MTWGERLFAAALVALLAAFFLQLGVGIGRTETMALRPPQALETARIDYASGWEAIHYAEWRICRRGEVRIEGPQVRCDRLPPTSDLNIILVALER